MRTYCGQDCCKECERLAATKEGLTPDEASMLDSLLYELKMKYVCFAKK